MYVCVGGRVGGGGGGGVPDNATLNFNDRVKRAASCFGNFKNQEDELSRVISRGHPFQKLNTAVGILNLFLLLLI